MLIGVFGIVDNLGIREGELKFSNTQLAHYPSFDSSQFVRFRRYRASAPRVIVSARISSG